jgi:hypothetical protein
MSANDPSDRPPEPRLISTLPLLLALGVISLGLGLAALMSWFAHSIKPPIFGEDKLAQADELAAAGKVAEAARLYGKLTREPWWGEPSTTAVDRIKTLVERPKAQAPGSELAVVLHEAVRLQRAGRWAEPGESLYRQGRELMEERRSTDPDGALAILNEIASIAPKGEDVNATRDTLIESLVAAHPDDPQRVSQAAVTYQAQGQGARAVALLEPIRDRLGTTDGALILALADAREGHVDRALTLIHPYTHARLENPRAAEDEMKAAIETAVEGNLDRFLAKGDQLDNFLDSDPAIKQARERLQRKSSLVTSALELGTILLKHAQIATDRESRERALEEAEKLFLAVSRVSDVKDNSRLKLAEVYYWEGKHRDGRALLDKVLEERKREPVLLIELGDLLRRVGSMGEARSMIEEAYQTGSTPEIRWHAALSRSLIGIDTDDHILWLRRGNPTDHETTALLRWNLAYRAVEHGDLDQATTHFRDALALYDSMHEEPATLSNTALILLNLANLTGDQSAFDRGFARIEKAHKLQPANSVGITGVALFVRERALRDIIGSSIDLRLLKELTDLSHLAFLYHDQAGRKEYARRLRSHAGINRLIELNERALLLAPRRGDLYKELDELYSCRGETEKQRGLQRRLEPIDLDQSGEIDRTKDHYAGNRQEQRRAEATGALLRAESALKAVRDRNLERSPTFAVAANNLVRAGMSGSYAGIEADSDRIVALAEEANAAAPSYGTRDLLISALMFRAGRRLAHTHPAYARLAEKTRFSMADGDLIAFALNGSSPLSEAARQDPDIGRAVDLMRQIYRDDPEYEAYPWTWSVIHALVPDEAAKLAQTYHQNESAQISRAIQQRVEPVSASVALSLYWAAEMVGQGGNGRAILDAYAARGVPLPIESP